MIKSVFYHDKSLVFKNKGGSGWIGSHSADKKYQKFKINVRCTKWVSKYSSDSVDQEKYHQIPLTPTGSFKTGHYP